MHFTKYLLGNNTIVVSKYNGNQIIFFKNDMDLDTSEVKEVLKKSGLYSKVVFPIEYDKNQIRTVYISLHSSSWCNLGCKYCFVKDRIDIKNITIENAKKFIDYIIHYFPEAGKFIVDPTGSGEPLLRVEFLKKLSDYCKLKSNEINKEVLPMLVTNGTLLNSNNVSILQKHGYIFGISLDGTKNDNDRYRVFENGKGTFDSIIKNVKHIKHRQYIGVAVTITGSNLDLVTILKSLIKYFPTVSMKPVRSMDRNQGINEDNIDDLLHAYDDLYDFIISMSLKNKIGYIFAILNGDDYFGKFIQRVFLNQKIQTRCDAGIGRYSLAPNGEIYACPGAIGLKEFIVGDLDNGIDKNKVDYFWKLLSDSDRCEECEARFVCGGECLIVSKYYNNDLISLNPMMCKLKKHLFELAVKMKMVLNFNNQVIYKQIMEICNEKSHRFDEDEELTFLLEKYGVMYSFNELKSIKDDFPEEYIKIKNNLIK